MPQPADTDPDRRASHAPPRGSLPVLQYCTPAQLAIDPAYQRSIDSGPSQTLVRRIAADWDWGLCQPLVVARRREGQLFVVDGQHRLAAARLRGDIQQLPCVVNEHGGAAGEAAAFVAINQARRPLTRYQIHRAALAAGDAQAVLLDALLRATGFTAVGKQNFEHCQPGEINKITGPINVLRRHGEQVTRLALETIAAGLKDQVLQYFGTIFDGVVGTIVATPDYDRARMARVLATATQAQWMQAIARRIASGAIKTSAPADTLLAAYRRADGVAPAAPAPAAVPARRPTFEEQLARVAAGAPISAKVAVRRADPDRTLGGVSGEIL